MRVELLIALHSYLATSNEFCTHRVSYVTYPLHSVFTYYRVDLSEIDIQIWKSSFVSKAIALSWNNEKCIVSPMKGEMKEGKQWYATKPLAEISKDSLFNNTSQLDVCSRG